MPVYNCYGVPVHFPFDAYECQVTYMSKVIEALENHENALLESPTGTGKTLCLLCAVLAWREGYAERIGQKTKVRSAQDENYHAWTDENLKKELQGHIPRVIYTSRTHSQIKQVTKELKKTNYRPMATVVASREQLCVHTKVSQVKGAKQTAMCSTYCANTRNCKNQQGGGSAAFGGGAGGGGNGTSGGGWGGAGTCPYYMSVHTRRYKKVVPDTSLMDIEELVATCKQHWTCPFFKTREDSREANLIMCPYNYVIDSAVRKNLGINLNNSIVIFDEGHNIESTCENSAGFELSCIDIDHAVSEIEDGLCMLQDGKCEHVVGTSLTNSTEDGNSSSSIVGGVVTNTNSLNNPALTADDVKRLLATLKDTLIRLQECLDTNALIPETVGSTEDTAYDPGLGRQVTKKRRENVLPGSRVYRIFEAAGITAQDYVMFKKMLEKAISCIAIDMASSSNGNFDGSSGAGVSSIAGGGMSALQNLSSTGKHLEKIQKIFSTLFESFSNYGQTQSQSRAGSNQDLQLNLEEAKQRSEDEILQLIEENFKVLIQEETIIESESESEQLQASSNQNAGLQRKKQKTTGWGIDDSTMLAKRGTIGTKQRTLCFWCFTSKPAMMDLMKCGVRSVIITSGTLSPMSTTKAALGVPFNVELENGHVVDPARVCGAILHKGPTNKLLISNYENRQNYDYLFDLGRAIANFSQTCPGGMLIAFASYRQMEDTLKVWRLQSAGTNLNKSGPSQSLSIIERIEKIKKIFTEPRNTNDLKSIWTNYCEACVSHPGGALIFAIARGKLTEGVDFSDHQCRAVVVCGIPYPPLHDPRVRLKKQFLIERNICSPDEWYKQQAARSVNQTVGRVIRHRNDFGAVLLCDHRFSKSKESLSTWLKPSIIEYESYGPAQLRVHKFFKNIGSLESASQSACQGPGQVSQQPGSESLWNVNQTHSQMARPIRSQSEIEQLNVAVVNKGISDQETQQLEEILNKNILATTKQTDGNSNSESVNLNINLFQAKNVSDSTQSKNLKSQTLSAAPAADTSGKKTDNSTTMKGSVTPSIQSMKEKPEPTNSHHQSESVFSLSQKDAFAFRLAVTKVGWMQLCQKLLDSSDFQEFTDELMPKLRTNLQKYVQPKDSPKDPMDVLYSDYREAILGIRTLLLPAMSADTDEEKVERQQLVYNFTQFLHPRFRLFWRQQITEWAERKLLGDWAINIFKGETQL